MITGFLMGITTLVLIVLFYNKGFDDGRIATEDCYNLGINASQLRNNRPTVTCKK